MNRPTKILPGAVTLLLVIVIGYLVIHKGLLDGVSKFNPYEFGHLVFNDGYKSVISDYAESTNPKKGLFRFSESDGFKKDIAIWFPEYVNILVKTEADYSDSNCEPEAKDMAHLFLATGHENAIHKLATGVEITSEFRIFKGDELSIELVNSEQPGCGGTYLTVSEQNRIHDYPELFILIWCAVILLCVYLRLPLFVPVIASAFNALLVAVSLTIGTQNLVSLLYATLISLVLSGLWFMALALTSNRVLRTLLVFVLLLVVSIPVIIFGVHYLVFNAPPTVDTIHAMLQSHKNQIGEFFTNILGWQYVLALLIGITATVTAVFVSSKTKLNRKVALLFGLLLMAVGARDFASYLQMNPMLHTVNLGISSYFYELDAFQKLNASRDFDSQAINASTDQTDTTLVVVIGESASKTHFSTYGYPRITTPVTDQYVMQGNMLKFNAAYANHTYSNPTISRALTKASNYNGVPWTSTISILNLANAANINTAWISNKLKFGPWDNVMSVIGDDAQRTIHINTKVGQNLVSDRFDGALVPLIEQALTESTENKVVFVHLQGSHVGYASRYPESAEVFSDRHDLMRFGDVSNTRGYNNEVVNQYDNSIYYTDTVLGGILDLLKDKQKPFALLYFSDHGESVFSGNSHNAALFEYEMAEIPMLFWANQTWQTRYQAKWQNLQKNLDSVFSNDHIFEAVAGLLGINSGYSENVNDISSEQYQAPTKPTTLHGQIDLDQDDNKDYWLVKNAAALKTSKPSLMLSTRGQSVGEVKQFLAKGLGKVHIDVEFSEEGGDLFMLLPEPSLITLKGYLGEFTQADIASLVFRLSEFNQVSASQLTNKLAELFRGSSVDDRPLFLIHPNNLDVASQLTKSLGVGAYLPEGFSFSSAQSLTQNIDNENIQRILVAASDYSNIQGTILAALNSSNVKVTIDASQQLSFHLKSAATQLLEQEYLSDTQVDEVLLDYESVFSY